MGDQTTVAEVIKELGRASPLEVLQLCFQREGLDITDHLLQHADDLDFVQDTLVASGSSRELNPILNGVLAGFNRRRRYKRFKYGHCNMELVRLRFASTASDEDSDLRAAEALANKRNNTTKTQSKKTRYPTLCNYFQRPNGCRLSWCRCAHRCAICNSFGHGAVSCRNRRSGAHSASDRLRRDDEVSEKPNEEKPPNPRFRRARAA